MRAFIQERLTFANVTSVLALFVALAGTSYAAISVNGSEIINRSISGKKLELRAVGPQDIDVHGLTVPTATRATIATLATTAQSAETATTAKTATTAAHVSGLILAGQAAVSSLRTEAATRRAHDSASDPSSTIVDLAIGDTQTVLSDGDYTMTATCSAGPAIAVTLQTNDADTLLSVGNQLIQPGQTATLLTDTWGQASSPQAPGTREVWINTTPILITSPTGPTLNVSPITYGFNYNGDDCFVSTFAIGE